MRCKSLASGHNGRPGDGSCRATRRCARFSSACGSVAALARLGSSVCFDSSDAARSARSRAQQVAFAVGHYRNRDQRSGAAVSAAADPRGRGALRRWSRASFPPAAFRAGMPNKGAFPKEDPGRQPPPSTSCPCPAWFFRLQRPFFGGSETPVQERLAPLQLLPFVEFAQKRPPDIEPDTLLFPVAQSAPAGGWRRELFGQILPASTAAQNPQNPFEHLAVGGARPSAASPRMRTRKQGPDLVPLGVGQQTTVSRHRPSIGAADLVYLAFPSTQLPQNSGLASSFETASRLFLEFHDELNQVKIF